MKYAFWSLVKWPVSDLHWYIASDVVKRKHYWQKLYEVSRWVLQFKDLLVICLVTRMPKWKETWGGMLLIFWWISRMLSRDLFMILKLFNSNQKYSVSMLLRWFTTMEWLTQPLCLKYIYRIFPFRTSRDYVCGKCRYKVLSIKKLFESKLIREQTY